MHVIQSVILTLIQVFYPGFDMEQFQQRLGLPQVDQIAENIKQYLPQNKIRAKSDKFIISGFWESYRGPINPGKGTNANPHFYENDLMHFDQMIYSFVTLDNAPNPTTPNSYPWDGKCFYDATTRDCIEQSFSNKSTQKWMEEKDHALMK